jgi:hypothetical protein
VTVSLVSTRVTEKRGHLVPKARKEGRKAKEGQGRSSEGGEEGIKEGQKVM